MELLDERFFENPAFALLQSKEVSKRIFENIFDMAQSAYSLIYKFQSEEYSELKQRCEEIEGEIDCFNDYLTKLSNYNLSNKDNQVLSTLLQETGELKGITIHLYQVAKAGMAFLDIISNYEQIIFYCTNMWEAGKVM